MSYTLDIEDDDRFIADEMDVESDQEALLKENEVDETDYPYND